MNGYRTALRDVLDALERVEGPRGTFSCCEEHDIRCPKGRAFTPEDWHGDAAHPWECECGREQLDAAVEKARELLLTGAA